MSGTDFIYESFDSGIGVAISVIYLGSHLAHDSPVEEFYHVWAYNVRIINKTGFRVRLIGREWQVIDSRGIASEVRGMNASGDQPFIDSDGELSYTSGTYLSAPSGIMIGKYRFFNESDDSVFTVDIPCFSLDSPQSMKFLN